ncbi:tetratricopeptide repeat protein [Lentzea atacamensis]|uniref:Tetratricopeptide repeat protein n=1 Tax=Lentzea atacamensis TaxID=531938 RepID=A0ABX9DXR4_9PSEU|nr:tetratricopeptide repeat protein [Lentzea atacamensis]RAS60344.1 tetratricopeptide repeat protein [Lentzea atacamensis]
MKYTIDPQTLRDIPDEYEAWTQIGVAARMLGELDLAERALTKAFELRPSTAARLRLAHVLQWQGRFSEAHAEFAKCAETGEIPGFVHQHWGKCYFDEGRYAEALEHFRAALALREGGDPALVESTRIAITAAAARCS